MKSETDRKLPRMPARNPWLANSVCPTSHLNPAATDAVPHAGPTQGRQLSAADVRIVPTVFTSNATVKREGEATIVIASGLDGVRKIDATGQQFELVSFLPYPGLEQIAKRATPDAVAAALAETNAAVRAKDDAKILALSKRIAELGFTRENLANGVHNLIDKDGFSYAAFAGLKILKSTDDNDPKRGLRVEKVKDFSREIPDLAKGQIAALAMTYDGHLVAAAHGGLFLADRDLELKGWLSLPGEVIENRICVDETGVYVVTSKRMLKVVWTGAKLSYSETDGGWESEYNAATREQATAAAGVTRRSAGTPPTLMGFGDDPDKLVIIADGDPQGTNLVAFWRDRIPPGFQQKPGTRTRRIADQVRIEIAKAAIEPAPSVLGYGVLVLNTTYPKPVPDIWGNAMAAGVSRPAPTGAQKFVWNTQRKAFEPAWINQEVDNTDVVGPMISAASGVVYAASKRDGTYELVALDWDTGEIRARWPFPDDGRQWNGYGGVTGLLEDGDFLVGGLFALKRVTAGTGGRATAR
jgi:hypothetical protein